MEEASIWNIVDSCRIWESHTDTKFVGSVRWDPDGSQLMPEVTMLDKSLLETSGSTRLHQNGGRMILATRGPLQRGIPFLADLVEPVTVGVAVLADAGILFPAFSEGILFPFDSEGILFFPPDSERILFPTDPAGIPFPADLAEPVTLGVAGLADAGILFPAISEGILFPADLAEPVAVGVAGFADAGILFPAFLKGYCSRLTLLGYLPG